MRLVWALSAVILGCGAWPLSSASAQTIPIKHVVFIIKENRSFDNFFATFPGANGATTGKHNGVEVRLQEGLTKSCDLAHSWPDSVRDIDNGAMDGFQLSKIRMKNAYVTLHEKDIPNYWAYARNFALADNFFSAMRGPSFPQHVYLAAADSNHIEGGPTAQKGKTQAWGCDSQPGTTARQVDPATGAITNIFPCFDIPVLPDLLNNAGNTWRYYSATPQQYGFIWSVLDSIKHIRYGNQWTTNVLPVENFQQDVQNGQLADVTWITPMGGYSDHPPNDVCQGEGWAVQVMNAIMQSQFWNSTTVFITWDDWGGYYDHVSPPTVDYFGLGMRVPFLIISPWVKHGTATQPLVQHGLYEFSSMLGFAETVFNLPNLTNRDKSADNLMDAFDFNQQPLPPLVLTPRKCANGPPVVCGPLPHGPDDDGD